MSRRLREQEEAYRRTLEGPPEHQPERVRERARRVGWSSDALLDTIPADELGEMYIRPWPRRNAG